MRVLHPIVSRTYDPNPQGSATTQVTMAAAIPFQRKVSIVTPGWRSAGTGGLGDDPNVDTSGGATSDNTDFAALTAAQDTSYLQSINTPANASTPAQTAQPVPAAQAQTVWGSALTDLTSGFSRAGSIVATGAAQRLANRITGTSPAGKAMAAIGGAPNVLLLGGIALVAGWGLWSMMRAPAKGGRSRRRSGSYRGNSGRRRAYA